MDGNSPTVLARPAFAEVYREHFGFVCRSARSLGTPLSTLDDVVQEIFVVVHRRLDEFEGRSTLRTWLSAIVLNVVRHHRRALFRRSPDELSRSEREDPDLLPARLPDPHDAAMLAEGSRLLQRLLDTLDDEKREVFVLAELEELSVPEIASALGLKLNTTYSRLRLAREQFARALSRHRAHERRASFGLLSPALANFAGKLGISGPIGAPLALGVKWLAIGALLGGGATFALTQQWRLVAPPISSATQRPQPLAVTARPSPVSAVTSASALPALVTAPRVNGASEPWSVASNVVAQPSATLAEEARLLREADQLLRRGDAASALRLLDQHLSRFPGSVLAAERRVERISALCGLRRVAEARAEARLFLSESPGSPLASSVRGSCAAPLEPGSRGDFE